MTIQQESITAASSRVTVETFLAHGRKRLSLTLLTGRQGLGTEIPEPTPNRPGLALTGFFDHFAHKRLQVIGLAEYAYLQGLPEAVRIARFEALFATKIPCLVFTRGLTVFPELFHLAEEAGIPVMQTPDETKIFVHNATFVLEELQAPCKKVHGTMLEVAGVGVFIEGEP
ncbi:MAG: HPr(Ser) kinase/phosphatase, partial [Kiritimatiellae bacterium]|nr:HPr(Ser) kinase/phosphatase [Kiritimatiellia bacterium]